MKKVASLLAGAVLLLIAANSSYAKRGDVNARDRNGQTALMRAAWAGDASSVRPLIEAGAKVEMRDLKAQTALLLAVSSGHADVVELLLAKGAKKEARDGELLIKAAASGHADVVKLLLDAGANKDRELSFAKTLAYCGIRSL